MWKRHWGLSHNPFDEWRGPFVATPTHTEAVARLVHTIETSERSAWMVAGAGLGKSTVLGRALEATRNPTRRVARISGPLLGSELFVRLACKLGVRVAANASRATAWRALVDAVRLCTWQGFSVVFAIDDVQTLETPRDCLDLERLDHLDHDPSTRLTVLKASRTMDISSDGVDRDSLIAPWNLSIPLSPLTRSESSCYLLAKFEAAGRREPVFTPRAVSRIHVLSGGTPRGLDRLASLALMAAALRGLEIIPPEIVDDSARECRGLSDITAMA